MTNTFGLIAAVGRTPNQFGSSREMDLVGVPNCKAQTQLSLQAWLDSGLTRGLQLLVPLLPD